MSPTEKTRAQVHPPSELRSNDRSSLTYMTLGLAASTA
jgi:hypothetical protein